MQGKPTPADLLRFRTAAGASILTLFVDDKKQLGYRNDVAGTTTASTTALGSGWQDVRVHVAVNGASSQVEVWLGGAKVAALSRTDSLGTTQVGRIELGESATGATYDVDFDNVSVDTK